MYRKYAASATIVFAILLPVSRQVDIIHVNICLKFVPIWSFESVSLSSHRAVHLALRPGLLQLRLPLARLIRKPRDLVLPLFRRASGPVSACESSKKCC